MQAFGHSGMELPTVRRRKYVRLPFCGAGEVQGVHGPQWIPLQHLDASGNHCARELYDVRVADILRQSFFGNLVLPTRQAPLSAPAVHSGDDFRYANDAQTEIGCAHAKRFHIVAPGFFKKPLCERRRIKKRHLVKICG